MTLNTDVKTVPAGRVAGKGPEIFKPIKYLQYILYYTPFLCIYLARFSVAKYCLYIYTCLCLLICEIFFLRNNEHY